MSDIRLECAGNIYQKGKRQREVIGLIQRNGTDRVIYQTPSGRRRKEIIEESADLWISWVSGATLIGTWGGDDRTEARTEDTEK